MIKAVIFDYDGVLVDSINIVYEANQKIVKKFGGKPFKDFDDFRMRFTDWKKFYQGFDASNPDIVNAAQKMFRKEFHKSARNVHIYIEHVLKKNNLLKFFDTIAGGESTENLKPHPDHLRVCMKELKVRPSETCEVGDAPWDIKAAKAAKITRIVAVTYGISLATQLRGADVIVDTPPEIIGAVKG